MVHTQAAGTGACSSATAVHTSTRSAYVPPIAPPWHQQQQRRQHTLAALMDGQRLQPWRDWRSLANAPYIRSAPQNGSTQVLDAASCPALSPCINRGRWFALQPTARRVPTCAFAPSNPGAMSPRSFQHLSRPTLTLRRLAMRREAPTNATMPRRSTSAIAVATANNVVEANVGIAQSTQAPRHGAAPSWCVGPGGARAHGSHNTDNNAGNIGSVPRCGSAHWSRERWPKMGQRR